VDDLDDYELDETRRARASGMEPEPPGPERGFRTALIAAAVLLAAGVTGIYLYFRKPAAKPAPTPVAAVAPAAPEVAPTPAIALPSLDASDDLVRDLARGFSSNPGFGPWLLAKNLIRTFVAVVTNVVDGENPAPHVPFLAAKPPFQVLEKRGRAVIDTRSYARLDGLADVVASLNAEECARVYRLVEPLADAAYRELGHPEGGFTTALGSAIGLLLQVPILEADVPVRRVVRAIVVYEYADARLEAMGPAQKALLRMGPRNVPRVQAKLRELAAALGLPAGRSS
jgi:hypothetical protein